MVINVCSAQTTRDSKLMDCDKLFEMCFAELVQIHCEIGFFCARMKNAPNKGGPRRTMANILSNFSRTRAHRSNKSLRSTPMITIARQRTTKAEKILFVSLFPAHSLYNNRKEKFDKLTSSLSSVADVSSLD